MGWVRRQAWKIWKNYMHPNVHGVWKKIYNIPFTDWKAVDEYQYPIESTSLSANFAAVLPEVEILLNSCIEQIVIPNDITQDNSKMMEDKSNKTVNFCIPDKNMEEVMVALNGVVKVDQRAGGPHH